MIKGTFFPPLDVNDKAFMENSVLKMVLKCLIKGKP